MGSSKSSRPQNLHPDALIQSRKDAAHRNEEAVRVTVQAMQRRKTDPRKITVQAVAREAGVSVATIYRRGELFALVQKANPELQRRQAEQVYREDRACLQAELADARRDADYYKREAELVKIGSLGLKQEITRLRKKKLELQLELAHLKVQVANSTREGKEASLPHLLQLEPH